LVMEIFFLCAVIWIVTLNFRSKKSQMTMIPKSLKSLKMNLMHFVDFDFDFDFDDDFVQTDRHP